jgi:nucleoside phosphorylase/CheY-like chemotaxis protein
VADKRALTVLIVEDDGNKRRSVVDALTRSEWVSDRDIDVVDDRMSARRRMEDRYYDLLILDVQIPDVINGHPSPTGGADLLDDIAELDDELCRPGYIIGLTAHQELLGAAGDRFADHLWMILEFDPTSIRWEERLIRIARHLATRRPDERNNEFAVELCVITALRRPEFAALRSLPWTMSAFEVDGDPTTYYRGSCTGRTRNWNIVGAYAPAMGMPAAAALASKMILQFKPEFLAMTGITAGVVGECALGDIIAVDQSWDWGSGKRSLADGLPIFSPDPQQHRMSPVVRNRVARLADDNEFLNTLWTDYDGGGQTPTSPPSIRIGPVASGASVLQDPEYTSFVKQQQRKLLGIEMETYGVYAAAAETRTPEPHVFSIKGVVDFADEHKSDHYQEFASYASARVLRELVETRF